MAIFVRRPLLSLVVSLVLLIAGAVAVKKISVLQFPEIESSSLVITTEYRGASANVVQGFVTEPVERVAMTVPGVDYVDSNTTAGVSRVTAWLKLNEDSTSALAELTARLNQISYELPDGADDPYIAVERTDRPAAVFYLNVRNEHWSRAQLTDYLERHVTPLLTSISGVQRVGIEGGRNPAMRIWLDPVRMSAMNLGAGDVLAALRANNIIASLGKTENELQQVNLQSNATLGTVGDFQQLVLTKSDGVIIRLGDIADVQLGEDRGSVSARNNKTTTVFISIWPMPGANEISIGDEVYRRLNKINPNLPQGMEIEISYDGTAYMRKALKEIIVTLIETIIIVGLVVLALMGAFRTALVPLVTIPISILGCIAIMWLVGFSLNLLTILAIVLSVGLVVDDAIVVVENVARHMREGKSRIQSALLSSRELLKPIIGMTLTLAAVYTPIGFVSGLTGSLFREFAFTLSVAVLISGIVAITLSPVMSAWVCPERGRENRYTLKVNQLFDRLRAFYGRCLNMVFQWRNQVLFLAVFLSLLIAPLYLFSAKELAPVEDQGSINIVVESSPGASIAYTDHHMNQVIDSLSGLSGVELIWQVITAEGGFGGIEFVDYSQRSQSVHEMLPAVFGTLSGVPGLKVFPILFSSLPTAGQFDVELVVQAPDDYPEMEVYARKLIQAAYQSGQFMFVNTDLQIHLPEMRLKFDHNRIADLGMTVYEASEQLSALLSEQDVNRFNATGKAYRVIPMVANEERYNPESLLDFHVRTPLGELVPLRAIARFEKVISPRVMGKFNQQRSFRILAGVLPGTTNEQALATLEKAALDILPETYTIDYGGVSRQLRQEGNSMFSVLLMAMAVVYMLLAIQFNSFRSPLVILLGSVPLALFGGLLFSFVGLTTINIYAQIGFITLVALVAKNGILITEFANELQLQGYHKLEAIRQAAKIRLRPVLMTTAATVLGHFPLVLVTGAGAEARNSIGIVLVAGMLIGTFFTLFVLPCVYLWLGERYKQDVSSLDGEHAKSL